MRPPARVRWGVALLAWAVAFALTLALRDYIERSAFVFFWVAVLTTAWYAGFIAALVAALASVAVVDYWIVEPRTTFGALRPAELLTLGIFVFASMLVSSLAARLARLQRETQRYADELELHAARLEEQAVELEQRTEEAQSLTEELEETNEQLEQSNLALVESEARWRELADATPVLVWSSDEHGRRNFYNRVWLDFTGRSMSEELGDGWVDDVHPDDRERVLEIYQSGFRDRSEFEFEYRLRRHDGAYRWILAHGVPRYDGVGTFIGFIGSCVDITERREAEEARERALHAAESASRAKSEFLATMSHELRTPLNAIAGYVELLEMGIQGPVNEAQKEAFARIQKSQRVLLSLVNDVLNLARIESGSLLYRSSEVVLDDVLVELEALVAPQMAAKGLRYEYERVPRELTVWTDRERLQQILINLLSNAIKFTDAGGSVRLEGMSVDDDVACVRVQDSGRGIPEDQLEAIFHPFVQVDRGYTRTTDGTGLGLAISRDLARAMGGDILVESELGGGSTFSVLLPRQQRVAVARATPGAALTATTARSSHAG